MGRLAHEMSRRSPVRVPERTPSELVFAPARQGLADTIEANDLPPGVDHDHERGDHVEQALGEDPLTFELLFGPSALQLRGGSGCEDLYDALRADDLVQRVVVDGAEDPEGPAGAGGNAAKGVLYSPLPEGPIRNVGEVGQSRLALHDVVGSAGAHDLHGHPLAALAGHDHHRWQRPLRAAAEKVDTLPIGESPVGDDDVRRRFGLEGRPGRLHRPGHRHGKGAGPGIECPPGQLGVSGVVLHQEHLERARIVPIRDVRRLATGRVLPPVRWNPCDKFSFH